MASAKYVSAPVIGQLGEMGVESVPGLAGAPAAVPVNLVAIKSQSDFFDSERCDARTRSRASSNSAETASSLTKTTGYLDDGLQPVVIPDLLSFEPGGRSGQLWLGGVNDVIEDDVAYTPMTGRAALLRPRPQAQLVRGRSGVPPNTGSSMRTLRPSSDWCFSAAFEHASSRSAPAMTSSGPARCAV